MATTELYNTMIAAIHAFDADNLNLEKLRTLEAAEEAYYSARAVLRKRWDALPEGERKDSAETNANETEGTEADKLRWFEVALMTYDLHEGE